MDSTTELFQSVRAELTGLDRQVVISNSRPTLRSRRTIAGTRQANEWELPAPSTSRPNDRDKDVLIQSQGRHAINRQPRAIRPIERSSTTHGSTIGQVETSACDEMRSLLGQWAIGQIRDFGYFISGVTHERGAIDPLLITERSMTWSTQSKVCDLYLEYQTNKNQDPPIAPIHGVIDSTTESIERLRVAMRRVLIRTRLLTPLPRVQAVDSACLAWLTRQPGRTHTERAGPRQRIMAVCRTDTCNTYENRVLKAFLSLAIVACNQYLGDFDNESNSIHARVTRVRDFKRIANEFYESEAMETVNTLTSDSSPNYVLQFDPVYAPVWDSYLVLKAKRKQEDVLWQWRHRSIGELFLIDLMASLHAIRTPVQQTDQERELAICQDPTEGHWLACPVGLDGAKLAINPEIVCSPLAPLHKHIDSREATPLADAALQLANSRTGQVLEFSFLLLVHDEQPTHHSWDSKAPILVMPDLHQSRDTPEERAESMIRTGNLSWPDGHQQRQATAVAVIHRLSRLLANSLHNG